MVLLRDHDDRLLLVRQPPATGWSLPGGLLDRREHPRDAAVREVREEIGVSLDPDTVTPIVPNAHVNPWVQQVDLIFTATVDADDIVLTVDEVEIGEARWFTLEALPPLTGPTFRLLGRAGLVSPDAAPDAPSPAPEALPAAGSRPDPADAPDASSASVAGQDESVAEPGSRADDLTKASESAADAEPSERNGAAVGAVRQVGSPGAMSAPATVMGAVLDGGAERTDAVLAEPGEAFGDPEATTRADSPTVPAEKESS
ncbi:NUDIX hydrolase [Cryptosporangium japonicum]|uniref:NUDIX hydrolase n=1 Tax=Cryptosporangium japonicum TaxID=80872 RepID=UPI0031DA031B